MPVPLMFDSSVSNTKRPIVAKPSSTANDAAPQRISVGRSPPNSSGISWPPVQIDQPYAELGHAATCHA